MKCGIIKNPTAISTTKHFEVIIGHDNGGYVVKRLKGLKSNKILYGNKNVISFLVEKDYIDFLNKDELHSVCFDENDNLKPFLTRFLHKERLETSIGFPLLKNLVEKSDLSAKVILKEEIAKRISGSSISFLRYFILEGFLDYLNLKELSVISNLIDFDVINNQELMKSLPILKKLMKLGIKGVRNHYIQGLSNLFQVSKTEFIYFVLNDNY